MRSLHHVLCYSQADPSKCAEFELDPYSTTQLELTMKMLSNEQHLSACSHRTLHCCPPAPHPSVWRLPHRSCAHLAGSRSLSEYVQDGVLQPMQEAEDLIALGELGFTKALEVVIKVRDKRAQEGSHEMHSALTLPSTSVFPGNHLAPPRLGLGLGLG